MQVANPLVIRAVELQHGGKGFTGQGDAAELAHLLFALLLLLEQLFLSRDVAAVALGENVLAQRLDGLPGDDLAADGGLDGNFKLGAGDVLLQLFADLPGAGIGVVRKEDEAQGVHCLLYTSDAADD